MPGTGFRVRGLETNVPESSQRLAIALARSRHWKYFGNGIVQIRFGEMVEAIYGDEIFVFYSEINKI